VNEFDVPMDLASCPVCRCLVCLVRYVDSRGAVPWDPRFLHRRLAVSTIGIHTWADWLEAGQRWGLCYDRPHECPPDELPPAVEGSHAIRIY
jgi:hypothetical protein